MKNDDVELIQRVLAGDENAFSMLVRKYQKPVHALVWRKIRDFHIAEEITQDAFLKAYKELAKLKKPHRFARWLSVIATRACIAWLRKKRLSTQSLENMNHAQLEKATYSGYVVQENERTEAEAQREVVQKLLSKLRENERTVITLHYFGEMTCEEISEFLGASVGTIKSRLRRAQQRLKREEPMVREALSGFQIAPNFTENVMREVSRITSISSTGRSQPFAPWVIGVSAVAVVLLILGIGYHYSNRFGMPFDFESEGDITTKAPKIEKIAFTSTRDGNGEIYVMNPDGSQQVNLTKHPADDLDPAWSPTGEQILFNSNRDGEWDLYFMDADGKNVRKVFAKSADRREPTWSPDGKQIAYLKVDEWAIYTATINGKTIKKIANTGEEGGSPAWSPDGSEIVFTLAGAVEKLGRRLTNSRQLRVVNINSGAARTLFTEQMPTMENPVWSPNGEQLAFSWTHRDLWDAEVHKKWGKRVFDAQTIYIAERNGGEFQQIVSEEGPATRDPAWSPLGDELLYIQKIRNRSQIFKIHVEDGRPEQLTNTDGSHNHSADWFGPLTLPSEP